MNIARLTVAALPLLACRVCAGVALLAPGDSNFLEKAMAAEDGFAGWEKREA